MSTTAAPETRRKRSSRKRGGGSRRKRSGGGQLQLHQTKVTFRNISTKFETAKQIFAMISEMIEKVNGESKCLPIKLDENSVDRVLMIEQLVEEENKEKETSAADNKNAENRKEKENRKAAGKNNENGKTLADVVKGEQQNDPSVPFISARALYVVSPKTSRRRGDKSGCVYLVLTPPAPPLPQAKQGDGETKNNAAENSKDQTELKYTQAERSRLTAISKLQLMQAIEVMSEIAQQDAKTHQHYGACQVEASISGKAWRDKEGGNRDRREGTIENTSDYKQFFNKQTKAEEERQSRPKPAPGGGAVGVKDGENGEVEEQLSAIVLHLRAKHKEQNQRKKAKKKANKEAKKVKSQSSSSSNKESGKSRNGKVSSASSSSKRKRSSKKKSSSGDVQGPVVLMKASQNGSG